MPAPGSLPAPLLPAAAWPASRSQDNTGDGWALTCLRVPSPRLVLGGRGAHFLSPTHCLWSIWPAWFPFIRFRFNSFHKHTGGAPCCGCGGVWE